MENGIRWIKGRGFNRFCYTYKDIAEARGVTVYAVRQAVARGKLDPTDIKSIARYVLKQKEGVINNAEGL